MIEHNFNVPFVAALALREKQVQQNYRPVIAVHKWFARRPGTLFRALLIAEFSNGPVHDSYYRPHRFDGVKVFDPFMGGGTTMMEANRIGCSVTGSDINPMAWWIVRQELLDLDLEGYLKAADALRVHLEQEVGALYRTSCIKCGSADARAKYFLWVKTVPCTSCSATIDLFPNYLLADNTRHTANVFVCGYCGSLFEHGDRQRPGPCPECRRKLPLQGIARRNRVVCRDCGTALSYPTGPVPEHRMYAIEYHCDRCTSAAGHKGRLFKKADKIDLENFSRAQTRLRRIKTEFVPDDEIPGGDETERLHRWGYRRYRDLFNARQLLSLELSCRRIAGEKDARIREALATNLSDLLRYQNMLCRYDTMALKSLDIFSVHGFPVGLIQCESNFLGIPGRKGMPVGSGGWLNIVEKFAKAKRYCTRPFEIRHEGGRKIEVLIPEEWIGTVRNGNRPCQPRHVDLRCSDSSDELMGGGASFDIVLTDPPYFGNVQYAELMDFCYIWLRKLMGKSIPEFAKASTRHVNELTANVSMRRGIEHFTEGLSRTLCSVGERLKPGNPLAFTYHHNQLDAYIPLAVAILDAGLVCTASLPCPGEMGASIHINGTSSSIIDTVFVCRSKGRFPRRWLATDAAATAGLIREDIELLAEGGIKATQGDIRCICYGHLIRLAIWNLRAAWDPKRPVTERMSAVREWLASLGGPRAVLAALDGAFSGAGRTQRWAPVKSFQGHDRYEDEVFV